MTRKVLTLSVVLLFVFCLFPAMAYANSAEPPALIVIMKSAPEDVSVSIVVKGGATEGQEREVAWETYFVFYQRDLGSGSEITLRISGDGESYDQIVGKAYLTGYNSIVTLDFSERSIAAGKLLSRSILLVARRVLSTLAIEGAVFYLFGFRAKRSWIAFFAINLLTQGVLNIILNGASPLGGYLILTLIFLEFFVLIAEIIGVLLFIKEHKKFRRISYALIANAASLVLGGYLITALPV